MSSKRRVRRRQCTNKKSYPDQAQAQSAIILMQKRGVAQLDLHFYKCQFGNHWHVGREPKHFTGRLKFWEWSGET